MIKYSPEAERLIHAVHTKRATGGVVEEKECHGGMARKRGGPVKRHHRDEGGEVERRRGGPVRRHRAEGGDMEMEKKRGGHCHKR